MKLKLSDILYLYCLKISEKTNDSKPLSFYSKHSPALNIINKENLNSETTILHATKKDRTNSLKIVYPVFAKIIFNIHLKRLENVLFINSPSAGKKWLANGNEHSHRPKAVYMSCCLRPISNRKRNHKRQEPYYTSYDFCTAPPMRQPKAQHTAITTLQAKPVTVRFFIIITFLVVLLA